MFTFDKITHALWHDKLTLDETLRLYDMRNKHDEIVTYLRGLK